MAAFGTAGEFYMDLHDLQLYMGELLTLWIDHAGDIRMTQDHANYVERARGSWTVPYISVNLRDMQIVHDVGDTFRLYGYLATLKLCVSTKKP